MRTLVAYFSWSGNTKEIAERIARKTPNEETRTEFSAFLDQIVW